MSKNHEKNQNKDLENSNLNILEAAMSLTSYRLLERKLKKNHNNGIRINGIKLIILITTGIFEAPFILK